MRLTTPFRRCVPACALLGTALLAGCGGGGDGGPTRAEYVARANRICQAASVRAAPFVTRLSAAAAALYTGKSLPAVRTRLLAREVGELHDVAAGYVAQLRGLNQPSGDRTTIKRFLNSSAAIVDAMGQASAALGTGDVTSALAALQRGQSASDEAKAAAQAYGLDACESVVSPA